MQSLPITINPGDNITQRLDFYAKRVYGDNLGGRWLYLPDSQNWIAPYTGGFCAAPGPSLVTLAKVRADLTPGGSGNSNAGQPAVLYWTDENRAISAGYLSQSANTPVAASPLGLSISTTLTAVASQTVSLAPTPAAGTYYISFISVQIASGGGFGAGGLDLRNGNTFISYAPNTIDLLFYSNPTLGQSQSNNFGNGVYQLTLGGATTFDVICNRSGFSAGNLLGIQINVTLIPA